MAYLPSLPVWGASLDQAKQSEIDMVAAAYQADVKRHRNSQKPKQIPMIRHDSMFDDSEDDEVDMDAAPIEESVVEEVVEEPEHKSFKYDLLSEEPSWRQRQPFAMQFWSTVQAKHEPSQTFKYNEWSEEPSFRERQLSALSFWPTFSKREPSQTFKYNVLSEEPSFRERQLFALRWW